MESADNKPFQLSWGDITDVTEHLAHYLSAGGKTYDVVVGISKGGLIPAALLQQVLKIPGFAHVVVRTYGDDNKQLPEKEWKVEWPFSTSRLMLFMGLGRRVLVVDDIWDTGTTIGLVQKDLPDATYATLAVKHRAGTPIPHVHYVRSFRPEHWVVFPWELGL